MESTILFNLLAAAIGVLAHLAVFRKGEWDVAAPSIFIFYFTLLAAAMLSSWGNFVTIPLLAVVQVAVCHATGLYTSMLLYRAFFHRLAKYPGPFLARLSNLYITVLSVRKMHQFDEVRKLHAQYGDYVRVGPNELSIADPEAVKALYGSQSPVTKGPWYTQLEPRVPLFMARDKQEHARRRKVWDMGFTTKADMLPALHGYNPRISKAITKLLAAIDHGKGQPFDVSQWFVFLSFEIMEDLAFNTSSNMLESGKEAYILKTIRTQMLLGAFCAHMPWLLTFIKRIPVLNWDYLSFMAWLQNLIDERKLKEPDQPDIFSYILDAYNKSPQTLRDRRNLHGDAQLIVIAGSDTVAAALTHLFFHLAWDATLVKRLQAELDALADISHDNLVSVPLLDAVIDETLRLHPPNPSGTQRVTPPEGLWIGEHFVPGDTIVQVPSYTVFRDQRMFERAEEFVPERWMTRPEMVRDRRVFIPFNIGPYACVGKRLALLEIRRVVAEILTRYDVAIAPGETKEVFLDAKEDVFTMVSGPLRVIFTEKVRSV